MSKSRTSRLCYESYLQDDIYENYTYSYDCDIRDVEDFIEQKRIEFRKEWFKYIESFDD